MIVGRGAVDDAVIDIHVVDRVGFWAAKVVATVSWVCCGAATGSPAGTLVQPLAGAKVAAW